LAKHSHHFHAKFEVEYQQQRDHLLQIRLWVQHRNNFQNMRRYRERRGRFLLKVKNVCEEVGIKFELPVQRVMSFNGGEMDTGKTGSESPCRIPSVLEMPSPSNLTRRRAIT
jgi:hypothetical protein